MQITSRIERPEDRDAIRRIHQICFPTLAEANLVDSLRDNGDVEISLLAFEGGDAVGHAIFSRMSSPLRALGLGPVAVKPEARKRGIGARLIGAGLALARKGDWEIVFVLGDPHYYLRFGFHAGLAARFLSPYAGANFMALGLKTATYQYKDRADYAAPFSALSFGGGVAEREAGNVLDACTPERLRG